MMFRLLCSFLTLAVLAVSGCASEPVQEAGSGTENGPGEVATVHPVEYSSQELGSAPDFVLTPASPVSFQVEVPEGTKNLTVVLQAMPAAGAGMEIHMEGCGQTTFDGVTVGGFEAKVVLCETPLAGTHIIEVTLPAGVMHGDVTAEGSVPVA